MNTVWAAPGFPEPTSPILIRVLCVARWWASQRESRMRSSGPESDSIEGSDFRDSWWVS